MSTEPVTLPSGRTLVVNIAPITPANRLKKELAAALTGVDLSGLNLAKLNMNVDVSKLDGPALNSFKNMLTVLIASDKVEQAMLACAQRCTIDGEKVTLESFEPREARADFLFVAWEVIKENAGTFFGGVDFPSLIPSGRGTDGPP